MNILLYHLYVNSYDKVWAKICDLIKWKYLFNHMACEGTYLFSEFGKLMFQGRGYTPIKFDVLSSIEIPLVQFFLLEFFVGSFSIIFSLFHLFIYLKLVYSRTLIPTQLLKFLGCSSFFYSFFFLLKTEIYQGKPWK